LKNRINLVKCPVDCITLADVMELLQEAIANGQRLLVGGVNASTVVDANRDMNFRTLLNEIDIIVPDGYWIQVASRILRYPMTNHVAIVVLTFQMLKKLGQQHRRVYLLGAKDFVVREAANEIIRRFAGIEIAGVRDGYFSEIEEQDIIQHVNQAKPHLLLIGMSSPKKEQFMVRNRGRFEVPLVIGVGGLFDILGGKTREGPMWLRNYGLMWLFRFIQEPRKLWRRYTITNFQFIWLVLKQALSKYVCRTNNVI